jgi:hypothetical protein
VDVQCDGAGELGLDGLSIGVESREQLAGSRLQALVSYDDDLTRHINLRSLQDSNEVPFYQHRDRSAWDVHIPPERMRRRRLGRFPGPVSRQLEVPRG